MKWKRANPVYPVADVAASIEWYRRMFGLAPGHVNHANDGPNSNLVWFTTPIAAE